MSVKEWMSDHGMGADRSIHCRWEYTETEDLLTLARSEAVSSDVTAVGPMADCMLRGTDIDRGRHRYKQRWRR